MVEGASELVTLTHTVYVYSSVQPGIIFFMHKKKYLFYCSVDLILKTFLFFKFPMGFLKKIKQWYLCRELNTESIITDTKINILLRY